VRLHAAAGALFPPKGEEKKSKVEAERHMAEDISNARLGCKRADRGAFCRFVVRQLLATL
jgi:hypothetical protein